MLASLAPHLLLQISGLASFRSHIARESVQFTINSVLYLRTVVRGAGLGEEGQSSRAITEWGVLLWLVELRVN